MKELFIWSTHLYTRSLTSWNPVVIETDFGLTPSFN